MRTYLRDGRAPVPASERTSALMSRIGARDTGPELLLRDALRALGVRGYRLHQKGLPGRPDLAFVGRRIAVFVHGCFWHGCTRCKPRMPRSNGGFWSGKIASNRARDARKARQLRANGWSVITVRECRLREDAMREAGRVRRRWSQA